MFTRSEYKERLRVIGLSKRQERQLLDVLDEMLNLARNRAEQLDARRAEGANFVSSASYFSGKADGINAVHRFIRGDMDSHDEFDD